MLWRGWSEQSPIRHGSRKPESNLKNQTSVRGAWLPRGMPTTSPLVISRSPIVKGCPPRARTVSDSSQGNLCSPTVPMNLDSAKICDILFGCHCLLYGPIFPQGWEIHRTMLLTGPEHYKRADGRHLATTPHRMDTERLQWPLQATPSTVLAHSIPVVRARVDLSKTPARLMEQAT